MVWGSGGYRQLLGSGRKTLCAKDTTWWPQPHQRRLYSRWVGVDGEAGRYATYFRRRKRRLQNFASLFQFFFFRPLLQRELLCLCRVEGGPRLRAKSSILHKPIKVL